MNKPSKTQLYKKALYTAQKEDLETAIELLKQAAQKIKVVKKTTLHFNVFYHLGLFQTELEAYPESKMAFQQAMLFCPDPTLLWLAYNGLAIAHSSLDENMEAILAYTFVIDHCQEPMPKYHAYLALSEEYFTLGQINETIHCCEEALAIATAQNWAEEQMSTIRELADHYLEFEKTEQAVHLLEQGLSFARQAQLEYWERMFMGNLSTAYLADQQLDRAKSLAEELLKISDYTLVVDDKTTALNNLAMYYRAIGDHQQGIQLLKEAIELEDNIVSKAIEYRNLSRFYEEVGDWPTAAHYLLLALEIVESEAVWEKIVKYRFQAGDLYFDHENYELAVQYFEACIDAYQFYPHNEGLVDALTMLGSTWGRLDEFEKGLDYLFMALHKAKEIQASNHWFSIVYDAIAGLYLREDFFDEAETYYKLSQEFNDDEEDIVTIFNIAAFYYMTANYTQAEELLVKAIGVFERQRDQLAGFDKRLFDDRYGYLYEYLTAIKARQGRPKEALKAIEMLKSRAWLESFEKPNDQDNPADFTSNFQPAADSAVLYFVNTMHNHPLIFCIKKEDIRTVFVSLVEFRDSLAEFEEAIERFKLHQKTAHQSGEMYARSNIPHPGWFDLVIQYFRYRLTEHHSFWPYKEPGFKKLAKILYDFLIRPFEYDLIGIKNLIIVPDRSLNLIPFETLIDHNDKFLIESFIVNYLPNLSLAQVLTKEQPTFEKQALLLGLTEYEQLQESFIPSPLLDSVEKLPSLRMDVKKAIAQGQNLDPFYRAIGIKSWPKLPGVAKELHIIQDVFEQVDYISEHDLTPQALQQASNNGLFTRYRLIHFANHGLAVPALPELSALVLWPEETTRHRYLNATTIASFSISAECINLAACETGLGELIPSIGNFGLAHAFLFAGAQSVQVSLWELHDAMSVILMKHFYTILLQQNWNYSLALALTKRDCLQGKLGETLSIPQYWANSIWIGLNQ